MILYSKWLDLPINIRHEIARIFSISKKNPTHVQDNVVVSDGYTVKDVESALSVANIQDYLQDYVFDDINILFDTLVYRIENPIVLPPKEEIPDIEPIVTKLEVKPIKTNVKKQTKK